MELAAGSNGDRSPKTPNITHRYTNDKRSAIAVGSLRSICGGPGGLCVESGDLRGLWVTLSPTHEARIDVAALVNVMCHVAIMRQVTGTRR